MATQNSIHVSDELLANSRPRRRLRVRASMNWLRKLSVKVLKSNDGKTCSHTAMKPGEHPVTRRKTFHEW
jgi:hypothetical protein